MTDSVSVEPVKIELVSGFLGAGKTTFINKLLAEGLGGPDTVLVENEFGDVSIDDSLLESGDMEMRTLSSGCICCTLRTGFIDCLKEIVATYHPARIIIEPTGMAAPEDLLEISDQTAKLVPIKTDAIFSIIDARNVERLVPLNIPAFDAHFHSARFIVLSHAQELEASRLEAVRKLLAEKSPGTPVVAENWDDVDALELLVRAEEAYAKRPYSPSGKVSAAPADDHGHHHGEGEEHHHHEVDGIASHSFMPQAPFAASDIDALTDLLESEDAGLVLRAKGFLRGSDDAMRLYEYVYGNVDMQSTSYDGPMKFVVIGKELDADALNTALHA
ncbi:MAG: CobW family GTP-binding protein [Coriobacteriales bacterium]|jgi:G3E family GTPase